MIHHPVLLPLGLCTLFALIIALFSFSPFPSLLLISSNTFTTLAYILECAKIKTWFKKHSWELVQAFVSHFNYSLIFPTTLILNKSIFQKSAYWRKLFVVWSKYWSFGESGWNSASHWNRHCFSLFKLLVSKIQQKLRYYLISFYLDFDTTKRGRCKMVISYKKVTRGRIDPIKQTSQTWGHWVTFVII